MVTPLAASFEWTPAFAMTVKTPIVPTAASHLMSMGSQSLGDGDDLPVADDLPIASLDCASELATGKVTLEHVDHVAEVKDGVIDGDDIRSGRPGNQGPSTARSDDSNLHHRV